MKLLQKIKRKWQKWLEDMAKANEKQFGHQPPSCCGHGNTGNNQPIGNKKSN